MSAVLFTYWFRYMCLLVLQSRRESREAELVALTIRLSYRDVQNRLQGSVARTALDPLYSSLESDYSVLKDLLEASEAHPVERKLLTFDYHLMRLCYRLTRKYSDLRARRALHEMAAIVGFFACSVGQQHARP